MGFILNGGGASGADIEVLKTAITEEAAARESGDTALSELIAQAGYASFEESDTVPSAAEAKSNVLYLVPNNETGYYDMYALVGGEVVLLDDTTIDLSGYATTADLKTVSDAAAAAQETAESAATAAETAQEAADTAKTAADNAATAAEAAQEAADNAATAASNAQTTADNAATAASNAQETADAAKTAAATAQETAEAAQATADTATADAKTAQETAETAKTTAETALSDAKTAQETAETAQSTADTAQSAAEGAQATAESAATAAETAQATADGAKTAAETAQAAAETAQSTAETAQGAAETAQGAAETAQQTAETAQSAAETAGETAVTAMQMALAAAAQSAAVAQLSRDGKVYGVKFPTVDYSSSPLGERTEDAVNLTAAVSTDTTAGTNDFDNVPLFWSVNVNGYLDDNGDFVETAVEGDGNFALDGSNGDVYVRFQLSFFRYIWDDANYEEVQVTDTYRPNEGWCPFGIFINADGSLKPYAYIAKYEMGYNSDGLAASISGVCPAYNTYSAMSAGTTTAGVSHNTQITITRAKGDYYCGMTTREVAFLQVLFSVEFATRNSQAIMYGAANYSIQKVCAYAEEGVERVLLTSSDAASYEVGSPISISVTGLTSAPDRGTANCNGTVNRKLIISKETVTVEVTETDDEGNETTTETEYVALNIDNGGVTFDTAADMYVTTMPWYTGACDGVLGSSGSKTSNTNGKFPMMYRGVENLYGNTYTIMSDVIISDYVPYICYDCTKYSTAVTDDYTAASYSISTTSGKYVMEMGYDEDNPSVRLPITVGGSASTYYCDYYYVNSGVRGLLFGGYLHNGSSAGLWCWYASDAVSPARWPLSSRLSISGRGV